ncbi:MAG TPA: SGNH/GDSL hydrolase family protein [Candidatus Parabacteroides intestinipullorum]|uniref:SGNH/GDSL hydrolase family protein n=1 Tax=Candidatus Parabacteroides intestinipullorum TaxID=2838723 RepID=A0A9D1XAD3_9BACT|nr:SGNH/GDSL hydrolase family protein [Candidatus Parabacteroides intestinipullorum]
MKRIGKILGLGLAMGGLLMATSVSAQTEKGDWAQFGRYADANKRVTTPAKVVFMGNSITDGWWPKDSTFFINNNFLDRGISGQTTSEMLVRFRQDVINLKPKAVVILAGINDIAHNNGVISLENVFGNIVSMAELARYNKITPIICSVLPAYDFPWRRGMNPAPKVIELNKMLKAYADKEGLTYVDYHSAMKDERDGLPKNLASDEVHPTLEGYKIMEKIVLEAIHKTIGE